MSAYRSLVSLAALALIGATAAPAPCPADGNWDRTADFGWTCRYRADNANLLETRTTVPIVFMGDSITEGWMIADRSFFDGGRVDRGISGQTTSQMLLRFEPDVLALNSAIVHIMAGTNDIAGNTGEAPLPAIERNIRRMAEMAKARGIRVIIGSVLPARAFGWKNSVRPAVPIAELNQWLRDYARANGAIYADYYSAMATSDGGLPLALSRDGVHPNKAGYAIMRPIAEAAVAAVRR
jgi:lysophospholipase L1-like esterase